MAGAPSTLVPTACPGITGSVVLNAPSGLAISGTGDLFIADTPPGAIFAPGDTNTFDTNSVKRQGQPYGMPKAPKAHKPAN